MELKALPSLPISSRLRICTRTSISPFSACWKAVKSFFTDRVRMPEIHRLMARLTTRKMATILTISDTMDWVSLVTLETGIRRMMRQPV